MSEQTPPPDAPTSPQDTAKRTAIKTTIVGGQPPGNERTLQTVPVGIEQLIGMAAADPEFALALRERRDEAISAGRVTLTATELAILASIDSSTLQAMVDRMRGALPEPERRSFLRRATAALLALVGGGATALAATGCRDADAGRSVQPPPAVTGARPDRPPPPPTTDPDPADTTSPPPDPPDTTSPGTDKPDVPEPKPDTRPTPKPAGIRPDRPRPSRGIRPDRPRPSKGIRPDRPRPPKAPPGEDSK